MKFTVYGFLQKSLVEMGLDAIDAMLLRYFVDFKASNKMRFEMIEDKLYFWVNYDNVVKELPILNMKKRTIQTRFLKLRDAGVLTHYVKKSGGTYSFFGIGERYGALISEGQYIETDYEGSSFEGHPSSLNGEGSSLNEHGSSLDGDGSSLNEHGSSLDGQGSQFKVLTEYPSTKDPSIINNTPSPLKGALKDMEVVRDREVIKKVIDYLNKATGKSFKDDTRATVKHIKARLKEGFQEEEFYTVIDNMVFNWTGTKLQPYLVPNTLFSSKFENYLHMGKVKNWDYGGNAYTKGGCGYGASDGFREGRDFKNRPMKQGNVAGKSGVHHKDGGANEALEKARRVVKFDLIEDM